MTHAASQPSGDRIKFLESRIAEIEEAYTCSICMERRRNVAFLCGHGACDICSQTLRTCHMCRKLIARKINLYWNLSCALIASQYSLCKPLSIIDFPSYCKSAIYECYFCWTCLKIYAVQNHAINFRVFRSSKSISITEYRLYPRADNGGRGVLADAHWVSTGPTCAELIELFWSRKNLKRSTKWFSTFFVCLNSICSPK